MSSRHLLPNLLTPFRPFLSDPDVTDIVVNRPGEIGVESGGAWTWHDEPWLTYDRLESIAIMCAFHTGQDIDDARPLCSTTLPTGERLQVCRYPATARGNIVLAIRRPYDNAPTLVSSTLERVKPKGRLLRELSDTDVQQLLHQAVTDRKNVIVCGATGTRKTTLTMALIDAIPRHERLVTIEDTPEWNRIPHRNRVALFYSKGGQSAADTRSEHLMEASLRLRPDRVLMQELRDGAAYAYLRSVVAGHPGCITTLHSDSAMGAFDALRMMVRQDTAGATLGDDDMRSLLESRIDVIIHMALEQQGNAFRIDDVYVR